MNLPKDRPRYTIVAKCKKEGCENGVSSRSKLGYCRKHRHKSRHQPFSKERFTEWLNSDQKNAQRCKDAIKEWRANNLARSREIDRNSQKRQRSRRALEEMERIRQEKAEAQAKEIERGYAGKLKAGMI